MSVAEEPIRITLEEFKAMKKNEFFSYELIDGIVMMSPSPSKEHQRIGSRLIRWVGNLLENTDCEVLYEYDIICGNDSFRPDIMVFCNPSAELPELIVEIVSPTSKRRDLVVKVIKYEQAGMKEYWIIDPKVQTVIVHDFINQTTESYGINDTIQSQTIPEIVIAVADIFPSPKSEHTVNTLF